MPDACAIDVDVRFLPEQDPQAILAQVSTARACEMISTFRRPPATVDPESVFVRGLCEAAGRHHDGAVTSIGRHGASDAVSFLRVGIPAVEFGPLGAGHHGPEEWVSVRSLAAYRRSIGDFVVSLPSMLAEQQQGAEL